MGAQIVIATGNPHKVEELRAVFALPGLELIGLAELGGGFAEPAETGATFAENASIKALSYAAQTGLPCLADDSGLEIEALGGAPGVISSHYCTDGRDVGMSRAERDAANNERVLRELEGVPPEQRSARFVCVMVLAAAPPDRGGALGGEDVDRARRARRDRHGPDPASGTRDPECPPPIAGAPAAPTVLATTRGTFEGRIGTTGDVPRGKNGFGYDPLFLVAPGYSHTSAELARAGKNRLSHRGAAARGMLAELARLLTAD